MLVSVFSSIFTGNLVMIFRENVGSWMWQSCSNVRWLPDILLYPRFAAKSLNNCFWLLSNVSHLIRLCCSLMLFWIPYSHLQQPGLTVAVFPDKTLEVERSKNDGCHGEQVQNRFFPPPKWFCSPKELTRCNVSTQRSRSFGCGLNSPIFRPWMENNSSI